MIKMVLKYIIEINYTEQGKLMKTHKLEHEGKSSGHHTLA